MIQVAMHQHQQNPMPSRTTTELRWRREPTAWLAFICSGKEISTLCEVPEQL